MYMWTSVTVMSHDNKNILDQLFSWSQEEKQFGDLISVKKISTRYHERDQVWYPYGKIYTSHIVI